MNCPQCLQAELTVGRENHHYVESGLGNVTLRAMGVLVPELSMVPPELRKKRFRAKLAKNAKENKSVI